MVADSRDYQHSGPKDRTLLCAECRAHFKKYGELPPLANNHNNNNNNGTNSNSNSNSSGRETPYLFRPVQSDSPDGSPGRMRTRNKTKETVGYNLYFHSINFLLIYFEY